MLFSALAFVAAGCNTTTSVPTQAQISTAPKATPASPTLSPQPPHPAPEAKISTKDWKVYTNVDRGISLQYPPSWKLGEYHFQISKTPSKTDEIAIDPIRVATAKEVESVDAPSGTIMIYFSQGQPIGYDSFGASSLGPNKFPVKYGGTLTVTNNSPNPAWANSTTESYYGYLPNKDKAAPADSFELRVYYPNTEARDKAFLNTIETILSTFTVK